MDLAPTVQMGPRNWAKRPHPIPMGLMDLIPTTYMSPRTWGRKPRTGRTLIPGACRPNIHYIGGFSGLGQETQTPLGP